MIEGSAFNLLQLQAQGNASAESITRAYLSAIQQRDAKVKAFLHVDEQRALEQARAMFDFVVGLVSA